MGAVGHVEAMPKLMKTQHGLGDGADVVLECFRAEPSTKHGVFAVNPGATFDHAGIRTKSV